MSCDTYHGRGRKNVAEGFAMSTPDGFPLADVRDKHACPDHIAQVGTRFCQGLFDNLDAALRLDVGIANPDYLTVLTDRRGTGHRHMRPDPDCPAIADHRLPRRTATDVDSFHIRINSRYRFLTFDF